MAIKVLKPGLATTVQDLGRPGYYHIGIPLSGGMDRHALAVANLLVGNAEGAAVLEAVFMGPELEFTDDAMVAVTGAELPPKLDGASRETWSSFKVKRGQKLSFDFLKKGARAYIAVAGGIDVPVVLGSRSTYALGALGGFQGRKLEAADELPVDAAATSVKEATASRAVSRWSSYRANHRSARAPIPPTSPTPAIRTARSRCPEAPSRSCCIVMRSQAAVILWLGRSFRPIWI
jgi:biotin-dependent carboxylase-like uncharacterized protein